MYSLSQIVIPKRSASCFKGGERLLPGTDYHSLLLKDENQHIIRRDFCPSCWRDSIAQTTVIHDRIYWKSHIGLKQEPLISKQCSRTTRALSLLKSLLADPDRDENEVFVLALFLAHSRRLTARQEIEQDGGRYTLYEVANENEYLMIKKVALPHLKIEELQCVLAEKLSFCP